MMLFAPYLMKKTIYSASVALVLAFALIYVSVANAQNATTNASNAMGNASAKANQTASELGKNASKVGGQIMNTTEDVGKKIAGGLGSLLGNASEKLKQGSK
jgi:predicted lactoylglutathione lyase